MAVSNLKSIFDPLNNPAHVARRVNIGEALNELMQYYSSLMFNQLLRTLEKEYELEMGDCNCDYYAPIYNMAKVFEKAKTDMGVTDDMTKTGFILPDGTMLDASVRQQHRFDEDLTSLIVWHNKCESAFPGADNPNILDLGSAVERMMEAGAVRVYTSTEHRQDGMGIQFQKKPTPFQLSAIGRYIESRKGGQIKDIWLEIAYWPWKDYGDSVLYEHLENATLTDLQRLVNRLEAKGIFRESKAQKDAREMGEVLGIMCTCRPEWWKKGND